MNSGTASVLLGNGDGTFQAHLDAAVVGNNINMVVGDFNRDGNLDLATSNTASVGTINVLKGHGDGTFDPAASYYAFSAPVYLAAGDFNHDGYDDFAVANSYAATSMSVDPQQRRRHLRRPAHLRHRPDRLRDRGRGLQQRRQRRLRRPRRLAVHGRASARATAPSTRPCSYATPAGRFERPARTATSTATARSTSPTRAAPASRS